MAIRDGAPTPDYTVSTEENTSDGPSFDEYFLNLRNLYASRDHHVAALEAEIQRLTEQFDQTVEYLSEEVKFLRGVITALLNK